MPRAASAANRRPPGLWTTRWMTLVYTGCPSPLGRRVFLPLCIFLEADLSAKRASAEAPPRLSRADGDPGGTRDPQAPAGQGPEAPFGVSPVQRRHRLSRSRDFDAVYRQGRSVSTRFLVLYWFPRDDGGGEPRLGLAVPKANGSAVVRNRIKRQLREAWRSSLPQVAAGTGLRPDRAAGPRRGVRAARLRVARPSGSARCSRRPRREVPRHRPRLRLALHGRRVPAARGSASTTRAARSTRSTRCASTASSIGSAKAGWRLLRCNPWSRGGVDYA